MANIVTEETPDDVIITLNVGGTRFETALGNLRKYPDSMLGAMFSGRHDATGLVRPGANGFFIDRCPVLFSAVLQFLRTGVVQST